MIEEQKIIKILVGDLPKKSEEFYCGGFRLAQICCAQLDEGWELSYSFDNNFEFVSLRFFVNSIESVIPSISHIYWSSFIYENEIADLFGLKFKDIAIDYKGSFYRTQVKQPFSRPKQKKPEAK